MGDVATTAGTPAGPLVRITLGALLAEPRPVRENIIGPWLRQGESCLLHAPTGVGKTLLAMSIAATVAGAGGFAEWVAPKPRKVTYWDGEMSADDLRDRFANIVPSLGGDPDAMGRNLTLIARQRQDPARRFPDLSTPEGALEFLGEVKATGAELVIIDNLTVCAQVVDENAAASFYPILDLLMRLKGLGVAVIVVHHSGKTGATYRGSSALATTFEVILSLVRAEVAAPDRKVVKAAFSATFSKFRAEGSSATDSRTFRMLKADDVSRWEAGANEDDALDQLAMAVRSLNFISQGELATYLGCSPGELSKRKTRLSNREVGPIPAAKFAEMLASARELRAEGADSTKVAEAVAVADDNDDF